MASPGEGPIEAGLPGVWVSIGREARMLAGNGRRIFWLGAHKLLVGTELARLRELGYEVYNPPYLSHISDQSVAPVWNRGQASTLPPEVFEKLSRHNFFYSAVTPEIADLLNGYFDAVVVTIVARWAAEILRVYRGPCIFRAYGQTHLLSDEFEDCGVRELVESRDDFHFSPHSQETLDQEAEWLKARATVVPYCLPADVFDHRGAWAASGTRSGDILVTAPNVLGNPFHRAHYDFLKEFFHQRHFRYCGVQLVDIRDEAVVGSLDRETQIRMFTQASGYLYTYRDPRVCYLPPIEMIVMGGPVAYFGGSLLARYVGKGGPGEAGTVTEAHRIVDRLRAGDPVLVREITESQKPVAALYDPAHVWPIFDAEMARMVGDRKPASTMRPRNAEEGLRQFLRLFVGPSGPVEAPVAEEETEPLVDAVTGLVLDRPVDPEEADALAKAAGESGPWAVLAEAVRLGGNGSVPLERATGRPQASRRTPIDLQRTFAPQGSLLLAGRWDLDESSSLHVRASEHGEAGFLVAGPYATLPVGRYVMCVRAKLEPLHAEVGTMDVVRNGHVVCKEQLVGHLPDFERFECSFEVRDDDAKLEFRVYANGSGRLRIESVSVERVSN